MKDSRLLRKTSSLRHFKGTVSKYSDFFILILPTLLSLFQIQFNIDGKLNFYQNVDLNPLNLLNFYNSYLYFTLNHCKKKSLKIKGNETTKIRNLALTTRPLKKVCHINMPL